MDPPLDVDDVESSGSEEYFDDTDSHYTDEEDEGSDDIGSSDVDLEDEDDVDDTDEESDEEDEGDKYLVEITKPYNSCYSETLEEGKYDAVTPDEWGNLKALIMLADGQQIAEWFEKRKLSPGAKQNISKVFSPLNLAARVSSPQIFNFLLGEGFPLNTIIHPFLDAALNHKFDIMETLLNIGSDVNVTDAAGTTALHLVARQLTCKPKKIEYLLSKGANIDQKDKSGMTPLHYALVMGSKGTVIALLNAGASVHECNGKGRPALHMAVYRGMKITTLVYNAGARSGVSKNYSEVEAAVKRPSANIVRFLIKRNAPVELEPMTLSEMIFSSEEDEASHIIDMLVGAGYKPPRDATLLWEIENKPKNMNIVKTMRQLASHPRTLQDSACFSIRNIIRTSSRCILDSVDQLQLPQVLKDYLLLKHVIEKNT